jgi:hypothetical protein
MSKVDMKGWSADQVKAYETASLALAAEEQAAAEELARRKTAAESPEAMIEAATEKAAALKRERERAAIESGDDRAYTKAVREHGGDHRVARVRTHEGSILLTPMGASAWEGFKDRIAELKSDADIDRLAKETIYETLYHPTPARFDEIVGRFPGIWTHLYTARNALVDGVLEEARPKG